MNKKIWIPTIIILFILGFFLVVATQPRFDEVLFEQFPYNYTAATLVPSHSNVNASLGGFFSLYGQGKNFKFNIMIPGAEKAESPLDYTSNGISGQGKIDTIIINFDSIKKLSSMDLIGTIFVTPISGTFNMSCAAWTGNGTFNNNGKDFTGKFNIHGQLTDFWGNYTLIRENRSIAVISDYDYLHWYRNETTPTHVHNKIYI